MPENLNYPGVYVHEVPSGARTIAGVATSVTAFLGRALRGPTDRPRLMQSYAEFSRVYGGLWRDSPLSYAVLQYFHNGGQHALIGRVHHHAIKASLALPEGFTLEAASEGQWGNQLRVRVEGATAEPGEAADSRFNLLVKDTATQTVETFVNLSTDPAHRLFVTAVLAESSDLVRVRGMVPAARPTAHAAPLAGTDPLEGATSSSAFGSDGDDGGPVVDADVAAVWLEPGHHGLWLLDHADTVNLVCIPPLSPNTDVGKATWDAAIGYAEKRHAIVLIDPPSAWAGLDSVIAGLDAVVTRNHHAALYFPRIKAPDPLQENRLGVFVPCGAVAGVIARTDTQRGIWTAPAGLNAPLLGVDQLVTTLTDSENGRLNQLGVNCLRQLPASAPVVWGARTLAGADRLASEWKYLPVRRTALYLEQSLIRGTQWVVFEPNDALLWAQILLNVGNLMHDLYRQRAFQGTTPQQAYFVKCDAETTTHSDIDKGIVNIHVGFAPLKPAEFVVISIQQSAGQVPA